MFKLDRSAVDVWVKDVDVFDVGQSQLRSFVESGRVSRVYPKLGQYIVVMCGASFGRDGWSHYSSSPRVLCDRCYDDLRCAVSELYFFLEMDLITYFNSDKCCCDYEIWHVVEDDVSEVDDSDDWYVERFTTMQEVVDYVEKALGTFAPEFDLWAIASEVVWYGNGWYYVTAKGKEFYRIVAKHEI